MPAIKYPIEVVGIDFGDELPYSGKPLFHPKNVGKLVAVRPCDDACKGKTYLGLYLGDIALSKYVMHDKEAKRLKFEIGGYNPAMFVFDLNRVVFGCGSWWGEIKSEEHLRQITDDDINNIWYVKALKQLDANQSLDTERQKTTARSA